MAKLSNADGHIAVTYIAVTHPLTDCRVTKVREFQRVAKLCDADGHMQQKLKQLLKLSKEKWDAACEHAKTAVQVCMCACAFLLP